MKTFLAALVAVSVAAAIGVLAQSLDAPTAHGAPAPASLFVPVQPCRLSDTRSDNGFSRVDGLTIAISTVGRCGIPSNATSLALTLTVTQPWGNGFLTAWPGDQARPTVSNLNFQGGQVRANGAITKVDASGTFRVFTSVPASVVVDVVGAFVVAGATAKAGRFIPSASVRLFDSRPNLKAAPGGSITIPLPAGVPADAAAVALNITITESSSPGFVTAYPANTPRPNASVLNLDSFMQTRAAGGIFPVSAAGITLYLSGGGHVVVDYSGYFTGASAAAGSDGLFTAFDPTRLMDTRGSSPLGVGVPVYPSGGVELAVARAGSGSIAYNITSVDDDIGFVRGFAAGTPQPATSMLNPQGQGDVVANFAITQVSNRGLDFWSQQQTHLVLDLQGWFSGAPVVATLAVPTNTAPVAPRALYSPCTHDGIDRINAERQKSGAPPLVVNQAGESFACAWALHLAQLNAGISHSDSASRDAAVGCPTGENVAFSTGTSTSRLMDLWMASADHHANIIRPSYVGAGIGYVTRTDPSGATTTYGSTTFTLC